MRRREPYREMETRGWMPVTELLEKGDKLIVRAELPGMKKEDIDVSISDNSLTIKGERKSEKEEKKENYYFSERSYGGFFRTISLPATVDKSKIEANFSNGVLEITIPKAAESQAKKIPVSAKSGG